jgi:hypothetical protein
MNQSYETQLQVVQRALGETVLPALAGAEKHVIEQLQLSMAAIGFMQSRLPHARRYYRGQLKAYLDMADAVLGLVASETLSQLIGKSRVELERPEADDADYVAATRAKQLRTWSLMRTARRMKPRSTRSSSKKAPPS